MQGDNGMIGFVNYDNEVVIPMTFRYVRGFDYVFKNGYCVITDPDTGLYGVIDREGEWKYSPDYDSFMQIYSGADYWLVRKDGLEGLLDSEMNVEDYLYDKDYFKHCIKPECYRYIHLDMAEKKDRFGLASVYCDMVRYTSDEGEEVRLRKYYIDFFVLLQRFVYQKSVLNT